MNVCTVCASPELGVFDALVLSGRSVRSAAFDRGLSYQAAKHHVREHLTRGPAAEPTTDDRFGELIASLRPRALKGDPAASREMRALLQAQAEARSAPPAYDVTTDPAWLELRAAILAALEPHPDALAAVRGAIGGL